MVPTDRWLPRDMRWRSAVLVVTCAIGALAGCASDEGSASRVAGDSAEPLATSRPLVNEPWVVDFEEDFEGFAGSADLPGSPGLPERLFAEDGSRWTQVQLSHPDLNRVELQQRDRDGQTETVLACTASGQGDEVASKADLGRQGFDYQTGSQVRITADLYLDPGIGENVMRDNTLIDLEDTTDLIVNGSSPGAGLRLRVDGQGRLALDRGEVPGREQPGAAPVPRLSTLRSDYVPPVRQWITLTMTLQLGTGAATSQTSIDPAISNEPAWVEVEVSSPGSAESVLAMAGTNMLDPLAIREVFDELDPDAEVRIPDNLTYDSLQVCATNNRSGRDVLVMVDNLVVESRRAG